MSIRCDLEVLHFWIEVWKIVTLFSYFNWLSGLVLKKSFCSGWHVTTLSFARILWHIQHFLFLPNWQHFDLQLHVTSSKTFRRFGSSCCLLPFFLMKMIMPSHHVQFAALDVIKNFLKFFHHVVLPFLKNTNRNSVLKVNSSAVKSLIPSSNLCKKLNIHICFSKVTH